MSCNIIRINKHYELLLVLGKLKLKRLKVKKSNTRLVQPTEQTVFFLQLVLVKVNGESNLVLNHQTFKLFNNCVLFPGIVLFIRLSCCL